MAQLGFNLAHVEAAAPRGALPAGKYVATVTAADVKETKSGTGAYLEVELQVEEGTHSGRKLWARHNIVNPSPQAQLIGQQQVQALGQAVGKVNATDSDDFVGRRVKAVVALIAAGPDRHGVQRDESNEVKGYESVTPQAHAPAAPSAAPANAHANAPWKR